MTQLPALQHLDLRGNTFGTASVVALLPTLRRLPALRVLTLDEGPGMNKAAETMRGSLPSLRVKLTWKSRPGTRMMYTAAPHTGLVHTRLRQLTSV